MLKIKDNVDLKDLEKYGYLEGKDTLSVPYSAYGKTFEIENNLIDVVAIYKKTKEIELSITSHTAFRSFVINDEIKLKKYIDDLIKDGLVEKVED